MRGLCILFAGEIVPGSRTRQRITALSELGHQVVTVKTSRPGATYEDRPGPVERFRYKLRIPGDTAGANAALIRQVAGRPFDLILPKLNQALKQA